MKFTFILHVEGHIWYSRNVCVFSPGIMLDNVQIQMSKSHSVENH